MSGSVKVGGAWKSVSAVSTKVGGSWKTVSAAYTKIGGTWKQWYTAGVTSGWASGTLPTGRVAMGGTYADFTNAKYFIAGGSGSSAETGTIATSVDGITWTDTTMPSTDTWREMVFDGTKVYAFWSTTTGAGYATTTNGTTWTAGSSLTGLGAYNMSNALYAAGRWYLSCSFGQASTDQYRTSTDGVTWGEWNAPAPTLNDIAYNGSNQFLALDASNSANIYTSASPTSSATSWTTRTLPAAAEYDRAVYGNGFWVLTNSAVTTNYLTSADGVSWTARTLPYAVKFRTTTGYRPQISFANGYFYYVATNGNLLYSANGTSWDIAETNIAPSRTSCGIIVGPDRMIVYLASENSSTTTTTTQFLYKIG